jgi:hypothetical protein
VVPKEEVFLPKLIYVLKMMNVISKCDARLGRIEMMVKDK